MSGSAALARAVAVRWDLLVGGVTNRVDAKRVARAGAIASSARNPRESPYTNPRDSLSVGMVFEERTVVLFL